MKKSMYVVVFSMIVFLGFSSCNKKDDGINDNINCTGLWSAELQDEINDWTNAAVAYSTNPTTANCNAYKAAATAYINALEPYGDCASLTGTQRSQWEQAISEAQAGINSLVCM